MSRLIEKYIRQAFEDRNISEEQSEKLWRYYYRYLSKAVDLGYSPTLEQYDPKLAHSLKYNIAEFSAFKETSFKKQIEAKLTKNGRVLSWNEFRKEAQALHIQYNRRWLETEYHQTIANAQAAEKFQDYIAEKSVYPNLKYRAINDERTREKHRVWDGLVLPVEHPFWQKYLPPNDWGCRCYVEQTAEPVSEGMVTNENTKEEFANNPALSGVIFKGSGYEKTFSDIESKAIREKVKERVEKETEKKISKELRKAKDAELNEWRKKHIPENTGITLQGKQFKDGKIIINRKSAKDVYSHFTEPKLKDLVKDIVAITKKGQFKMEVPINIDAHNYEKKIKAGYESYRYYLAQHKGYNIRINTAVINGEEKLYSLNLTEF